jgi:hypothetical protein
LNFHRRGGNAAEIAGRESRRGGRNPFFVLRATKDRRDAKKGRIPEGVGSADVLSEWHGFINR